MAAVLVAVEGEEEHLRRDLRRDLRPDPRPHQTLTPVLVSTISNSTNY